MIIKLFLERGDWREKEREGEKHRLVACCRPPNWGLSQACALTGNQTGDPSLSGTTPNPLSHTG